MNFSLAGYFFALASCEPLGVRMDLWTGFAFVSVGNSGGVKGFRYVLMIVVWLGFPLPYRNCECEFEIE